MQSRRYLPTAGHEDPPHATPDCAAQREHAGRWLWVGATAQPKPPRHSRTKTPAAPVSCKKLTVTPWEEEGNHRPVFIPRFALQCRVAHASFIGLTTDVRAVSQCKTLTAPPFRFF